jgi:hypothetical protein
MAERSGPVRALSFYSFCPVERLLPLTANQHCRPFTAVGLSCKADVEISGGCFKSAVACGVVGLLTHRQVNELMLECV